MLEARRTPSNTAGMISSGSPNSTGHDQKHGIPTYCTCMHAAIRRFVCKVRHLPTYLPTLPTLGSVQIRLVVVKQTRPIRLVIVHYYIRSIIRTRHDTPFGVRRGVILNTYARKPPFEIRWLAVYQVRRRAGQGRAGQDEDGSDGEGRPERRGKTKKKKRGRRGNGKGRQRIQ
ncbi:hypothetical protein LX32DRAFT_319300 [Colletotrichum zoysiae]|uniref:Uncharacterized protein n=1 Tax=Colletotrichum zoysiae TaxID=1216348 RepID=A0AAD9H2B8_9PEZI|nr:hypothetical protein LX32DRAFT_319300 [Colletotrichum zoysiae]